MNHRLFSNLIHMLRSPVSIPAVGSSKTLKGAQHKMTGKNPRRLFPNENWTSKDNWMARINYQSIVTDWWLCHGDSLDTELNATMCTETHQKRTWNVSSCYPSDWFHQFSQSYGIHHKYNFRKKKFLLKELCWWLYQQSIGHFFPLIIIFHSVDLQPSSLVGISHLWLFGTGEFRINVH